MIMNELHVISGDMININCGLFIDHGGQFVGSFWSVGHNKIIQRRSGGTLRTSVFVGDFHKVKINDTS